MHNAYIHSKYIRHYTYSNARVLHTREHINSGHYTHIKACASLRIRWRGEVHCLHAQALPSFLVHQWHMRARLRKWNNHTASPTYMYTNVCTQISRYSKILPTHDYKLLLCILVVLPPIQTCVYLFIRFVFQDSFIIICFLYFSLCFTRWPAYARVNQTYRVQRLCQ